MNSVSVISRAYDAEAPYIKSFIEHYTSIGCKEFHIVVPKGNPYKYLEIECKPYTHVKLYTEYVENKEFNEIQNIALKNINTSHILWVDIDEYLDIQDILPLLNYDYIRLNWVIVPYFDKPNPKKIPGFIDKQCKYIVKTELCEQLRIHDCELKHPTQQYESGTKLLHYVYRSFEDLYLKCVIGKYGSYQKTTKEQLINGQGDIRHLPLKFKMAATYQRIANASNTIYSNYCQINYDLEKKLIQETPFFENLFEYKKSLMHYSSRIDLKKLIQTMHKHKNYRLYGRVPHHVLSEIADNCIIDILEPEKWIRPPKNNGSFSFNRLLKN